ncbi:MAG: FG-GAP repeat protein, partial [Myxococcales bacterium]|nr:FG-GAP repeat protein [Myxococcales bacterium]
MLALVNCSTGGLQSQASCAHGQTTSACEVIASEAPLPEGASRDGWGGVQRGISAAEYRASENERGLQAPNRAHDLRTWFEATGIRVHDRGATGGDSLVDLSLAGIGRAAALQPVEPGVVRHAGARVEIERPGVTEWYENSARGLEQGFTLAQAPSGAGPLTLVLAVHGATATLREDSVILESATGRRLGYGGLVAQDAAGRTLPSRLEVPDPQRLRLVVEDAGATYPIVIDPLLTAIPDATLESNHLWSGTFDSAMFGHSLASAGDVNGDGFDDIVVGAFGWDVAGGLFDEGAAFVFLGGPDGIVGTDPTTANAVLLGDQAAGEFGWSVAGAGDVNGDGFDDIIVGAKRYDSPSGGGAAFVFLGSPTGIIGTGPPTAHASIFGSQSGGHLGTSVSGAGDINNDGFGDIIVGSPPPGRSALNGSALVFLGSAAGITGSGVDDADRVILPHPPDQPVSGPDLLGFDVDAAGDVNNDGFDDVLVASGSYMLVFHGSAAGIVGTHPGNADAKIESDATTSLYTVLSGAGDVNGDGFDDILVTGFATGQSVSFPGGFMVFHGSASGITATTPADADAFIASDDPIVIQGPVFYLGKNLAGAGDVDGDGFDDVLAAGLEFPGSFDREGIVHVFRGSPTGLEGASLADAYDPLTTGQEGGAQRNVWGLGIAGADVNGDGFADVLMGAGLYDAGQTDEGVVFVYHGEFNPGGSTNQVPVAYAGTD